MLQPLVVQVRESGSLPLPPPRKCECCGKVVPIGHDAINVMLTVGSPGHPELSAFQCPFEEHWACSLECWSKVAHACIDEHVSKILYSMHKEKGLL